ncbi:hypothetical protein A7A09_001280 [Paracoccus methylarcula]|uniref:Uncharacterized protein n=1 Tax=Paracoccus methylarcula TaxID=72022 RepID=A0A3R7LJG6_9RHOB|nr:hypothetical protein A7A09_001280 [Paracoccus methylarcula]
MRIQTVWQGDCDISALVSCHDGWKFTPVIGLYMRAEFTFVSKVSLGFQQTEIFERYRPIVFELELCSQHPVVHDMFEALAAGRIFEVCIKQLGTQFDWSEIIQDQKIGGSVHDVLPS